MNEYEKLAITRLPLVTTELARKAARAIVGQLGAIRDANPRFNFGLHKPDRGDDAAVILTNAKCDNYPDDMMSIDIDAEGKFTAHFGRDNTFTGDGNKPEDVAQIPRRIAKPFEPWQLVV